MEGAFQTTGGRGGRAFEYAIATVPAPEAEEAEGEGFTEADAIRQPPVPSFTHVRFSACAFFCPTLFTPWRRNAERT